MTRLKYDISPAAVITNQNTKSLDPLRAQLTLITKKMGRPYSFELQITANDTNYATKHKFKYSSEIEVIQLVT